MSFYSEVEDRTGELVELMDHIKDEQDKKLQAVNPREFVHNRNTDFDKLRKRVNYLSNKKNAAVGGNSSLGKKPHSSVGKQRKAGGD